MDQLGEISPEQLKHRLDRGERLMILDVRENEEVALAVFPGALHIPMGEIPARFGELSPEDETVVVCHHGMRSAQVAGYLADCGFTRVLNLTGGINGWSLDVDPAVPRY